MQIDDENSSSIDNLEKIAPKQKLAKKKVIPDDDDKSTTNISFQLQLSQGRDCLIIIKKCKVERKFD